MTTIIITFAHFVRTNIHVILLAWQIVAICIVLRVCKRSQVFLPAGFLVPIVWRRLIKIHVSVVQIRICCKSTIHGWEDRRILKLLREKSLAVKRKILILNRIVQPLLSIIDPKLPSVWRISALCSPDNYLIRLCMQKECQLMQCFGEFKPSSRVFRASIKV